jgi:ABC-type bacteriocin/lantibiotic exporter with double-glycine peptidase domain
MTARKWIIPEVIQTSGMDCGPASLKAIFGGYGMYLSYGRLREACQTDVDGTSIDTMEDIAVRLGMDAVQVMMPVDHLLLPESECLPGIVVIRLAGGATHFVVLWRTHGPYVQVMDPSSGRVWLSRKAFLESLYVHEQAIPAEAWEAWSKSEAYVKALDRRLRALGLSYEQERTESIALVDAAARLTQALLDKGEIGKGDIQATMGELKSNPSLIPDKFWTVRPVADDPSQVKLRGAVMMTASGPRKDFTVAEREQLPEAMRLTLSEPQPQPWLKVFESMREIGIGRPMFCLIGMAAAAAGTVMEALLFRGLFDLSRHLTLSGQRMAALAAFAAFLIGLLLIEWPVELGLLRFGRQLENQLRLRFLSKIPRLNDRYFQSRLVSDMAYRAHSIQLLRQLPDLGGQLTKAVCALLFTVVGIGWFFPAALFPAALAALAAVLVPALSQPSLNERDMRVREITGALSRFYLDALLGLTAIKAHAAERTLRGAQAQQLSNWAAAGLSQLSVLLRAEALQMISVYGMLFWLVFAQASATTEPAGLLLLVYWALSIPALGQQITAIARNYPSLRNTTLRFLEPLGSPEEVVAIPEAADHREGGVEIDIDEVHVSAGGHTILNGISLKARPGEHIGVVGMSGAGKSSLVGLLLGWHKPVAGEVRIDGQPLDPRRLSLLRRETAWIDPQVQLFNDTLFENLGYGNNLESSEMLGLAVEDADLAGVLKRMPEGLQTNLGEGGTLVSGGEGQRVRMGRAMARAGVRLAILDEPARGLDRERRRSFVERARRRFANATLFCITHDVMDTMDFSRVLVIEQGRVIEDGDPREMMRNPDSRYRRLYEQEETVRRHMWSHKMWRRLRLKDGALVEQEANEWSRT